MGIRFIESQHKLPFLLKAKVVVDVGTPIYPDLFQYKKDSIMQLTEESFSEISTLINSK